MKKELKHHLQMLIEQEKLVMNFLKSKYPLFHRSNVFFRDVQFGIKHYFELKDIKLTYSESELMAKEFIHHLESKNILKRINYQSYILNYPEFVSQKVINK